MKAPARSEKNASKNLAESNNSSALPENDMCKPLTVSLKKVESNGLPYLPVGNKSPLKGGPNHENQSKENANVNLQTVPVLKISFGTKRNKVMTVVTPDNKNGSENNCVFNALEAQNISSAQSEAVQNGITADITTALKEDQIALNNTANLKKYFPTANFSGNLKIKDSAKSVEYYSSNSANMNRLAV